MDGVGLDTGRHAACGMLNISLCLKICQTGSALSALSALTMESCWFSHVYITSMNFISVCELSFCPLRALNLQ